MPALYMKLHQRAEHVREMHPERIQISTDLTDPRSSTRNGSIESSARLAGSRWISIEISLAALGIRSYSRICVSSLDQDRCSLDN